MCYMIYFDNAATSFFKPESVKKSVINSINKLTANPGRSGHILSQKVAMKIFETREVVKDFFHASEYDLIFTKNCTEALNIALRGSLNFGDHVIATCYEHNSVLRTLEFLKTLGVEVEIIEDDMQNIPNIIQEKIKPNTRLVITNMVSNVTGEVCDVEAVGKICKANNILYLVDGAQSAGHCEINLEKFNIDMFTFAGHKGLLSLTGVGGLLVKNLKILKPIMFGGTGTDSENLIQPTDSVEGFEAGTISTISILSLKAGVEFLSKNFEIILKKEQNLSKYLYNSVKNLKFLEIYSKETSQNVFSFNIKNMDSSTLANILSDKYAICVRSGLHCAPLIHKKLKTLDTGAVRVSLDFNNTFEEIDKFIFALKEIASA